MNVIVINAGAPAQVPGHRHRSRADQEQGSAAVPRAGGADRGEAIITVQNRRGPQSRRRRSANFGGTRLCAALAGVGSSGIDEIRSLGDIDAVGHASFMAASYLPNRPCRRRSDAGDRGCIDLAPLHNPNNIKGIRALPRDLRAAGAAGCGIRYGVPRLDSRACLPVCRALPSLPPPPHPPLRLSRNLASLCGPPLPDVARTDPRTNQHHHASSGKRLFGGGDSEGLRSTRRWG